MGGSQSSDSVDRFKLALHREKRETSIYALVLAKNGPKIQKSAPNAQYSMRMGPAGMSATKMSIHDFADTLSGYTRRSVIDRAGLEGNFDFKFDWSPQDPNSLDLHCATRAVGFEAGGRERTGRIF